MNEQTQVPVEIMTVIKTRKAALDEAAQAQADQKKQERDALLAIGKEKFDAWLAAAHAGIPNYLEPYRISHSTPEELDDIYERIAKNWNWSYSLYFAVPGLAEVCLDGNTWKTQRTWSYDDEEPRLGYYSDSFQSKNLDDALLRARSEYVKHQKAVDEWNQNMEELRASRAESSRQEFNEKTEAFEKEKAEQEQERIQEEALLSFIKNDPAMLHILKALVLIQDERRNFLEQLNDAYESANYMQERHAERMEQMRRQVADTERQAADEKSRLEDERDAALKAKVRAERGW